MKVIAICVILTSIGVGLLGISMAMVGSQNAELNKRVLCLEQGRIYAGNDFCVNR